MTESKRSKIEQVHIDEAARLKTLFKERANGMSQAEFGATYEIGSQGMVWQYINAKSPLNLSAALKFARGLSCDVADFSERLAKDLASAPSAGTTDVHIQLANGVRHSAHKKELLLRTDPPPAEINLSKHPDLQEVPRVKFKLSAGVSGYAVEPEAGNGKPIFFRKDWFTTNGYDPAHLFAVQVSGQSMETSLWDGDLVVINTADTKPHDGDVYAINYEGELVIKRMRRDFGQWLATSDNHDQRRYAPKRCTEDVKIIGKVVYKQSERI